MLLSIFLLSIGESVAKHLLDITMATLWMHVSGHGLEGFPLQPSERTGPDFLPVPVQSVKTD